MSFFTDGTTGLIELYGSFEIHKIRKKVNFLTIETYVAIHPSGMELRDKDLSILKMMIHNFNSSNLIHVNPIAKGNLNTIGDGILSQLIEEKPIEPKLNKLILLL